MQFIKNPDGTVTVTLTAEEVRHFENEVPIVCKQSSKQGVVEMTLRAKKLVPDAETRQAIRILLSATGNPDLSIKDAIALLKDNPVASKQLTDYLWWCDRSSKGEFRPVRELVV